MIIVWLSELCTTILTTCLQNRQLMKYNKKTAGINPDLALSNISKHDVDKIASKLIERGFSIGSMFSYQKSSNTNHNNSSNNNSIEESKYVLTVLLSIELRQKLAIQNGIQIKQQQDYTSSQRVYLASKSIEIINRADIKCDIFLVHDQIELERIFEHLSVSDLSSYYGQSIGIFLSWVKYSLLWLQFTSNVGIFIFLYQIYFQSPLEAFFSPLLCILTSIGSILFDKSLQQHLSLSIFSWGHISTFYYLPSVVSPFSTGVYPIPPLILCLLLSMMIAIFYIGLIIIITFLEVLFKIFFSFVLVDLIPILSLIPPLVQPYFMKFSQWVSKFELILNPSSDNEKKKNEKSTPPPHLLILTCLLQFLNRFFLPLWFLFITKDLYKIRLFLACTIAFEHILGSIPSPQITPLYTVADTTQSILSNKPPVLRDMFKKSILISQLSFFNTTSPGRKKNKMKKVLNTGVKALMNAALTPRLFSQDSQHSIFSAPTNYSTVEPDHSTTTATTSASTASSLSTSKKDKIKKLNKWFPFNRLRGKSKSSEDSNNTQLESSNKSSDTPLLPPPPPPLSLLSSSPSKETPKTIKLGKEKKINRSALDNHPTKLITSHLGIETDLSNDENSSEDHEDKDYHADEISLSDSDSDSDSDESEIEMLWGSERKEETKETTEPFANLLNELTAEIFDPTEVSLSVIMLYATVVFFNGSCPLLSFAIANRLQTQYSTTIRQLLSSKRTLGVDLSPLHPHEPWTQLIQMVNLIGIIVNCYQAFNVFQYGSFYIPQNLLTSENEWLLCLLWSTLLGQGMLFFYWLFNQVIPSIPQTVLDGIKMQHSLMNPLFQEICVHHSLKSHLPSKSDRLSKTSYQGNGFNDFTNLSLHRNIELIGKQKLSSLYSSLGWCMRPSVFVFFSSLPLVIYLHSHSLYWSCLSLGFISLYGIYAHVVQLQRQRITCALGVVSDPDILELVVKFMPGWVLTPEKNRVDWLNLFLQSTWPILARLAESKVSKKATKIFEEEKPEFLTSMKLTHVVAGHTPPKILSIKILDTNSTISNSHNPTQVQLEVEFVWISDGGVVVEIGFLGQVFSIEICNLSISGTVRVALEPNSDLRPEKPFKLMKATFVNNPIVDVTVSFGDLLPNSSINAKVIGLGPIISQTINKIIRRKFVFPNWMQEIFDEEGHVMDSFATHHVSPPIGILTIQILSCQNLIIGDIITSDPFVEVHYLEEVMTTPVIYKTLNPEWKEVYFDLIIYDLENVVLKLCVFDHDYSGEADYLGSVEVRVSSEEAMELQQKEKSYSKKLIDGKDGVIQYRLNYRSLSSTNTETSTSRHTDLLFSLSEETFRSDLMVSSSSSSASASASSSAFPRPAAHKVPIPRPLSARQVYGILSLSNLELELASTQDKSHNTATSSSTNTFYISLSYRNVKKVTGIEKGRRSRNNHQLLHVPFVGTTSFVIYHTSQNTQQPQPTSTSTGGAAGPGPSSSTANEMKKNELFDQIILKITHKNKFGVKSIYEIYLSIFSFLQKKSSVLVAKDLKRSVEIGHVYTGQLKGMIRFIPVREVIS